ncbi:DegT/DnrJ/EryC1/StrS family aminotransferase [Niabella soli]|uniref:Pleiotropic regulatory protein n=1 Tax=Niabella soli DSM 19437 TaxID=929713 RepID=W0EYG5_9BACT|nr:DegT/DnrJ/EryC1/StrS family aminotransferase [Niabella soli]AHF14219.1 Pleiotropic regulatory protein [Niabella soli DSM 19437]
MSIAMVDLKGQFAKIKPEIMEAIESCLDSTTFINGPSVKQFSTALAKYLSVSNVIPCANGTDALQVALMALDLQPGDEVILPAFTYAATAEVIGLLRLTPVMVDVDSSTFNITANLIEKAITPKTRAIVPVHLFGQCADMQPIMSLAAKHQLYVVEDTAQAIGALYTFPDGSKKMAGTIGHIGCTSFFPSKNLGCYGDGGAIYTQDTKLAEKISMICNHGQRVKYQHSCIGVNSRLDTLQAAVLNIKLNYLDEYSAARNKAAIIYDELLKDVAEIALPERSPMSSHVFHQYTIKISGNKRDELKAFLQQTGIPSMIYYPIPLQEQEAYRSLGLISGNLSVTSELCSSVLSLPMHTELSFEQQEFIASNIKSFFSK